MNYSLFDKKISQQGFSLIELMVTLVIVAILAAIAAPSFNSMISDNRMLSQAQDIEGGIKLARSEAIKRGMAVSLCPSKDGLTCRSETESTPGNESFEFGWIIFLDNTNAGVVDNSAKVSSGGDIIVYRNQKSGSQISASFPTGITFIRFSSQGYLGN